MKKNSAQASEDRQRRRLTRLRAPVFAAALVALLGGGCSPDWEDATFLPNADKADSIATIVHLTNNNNRQSLAIRCEGETACDGYLSIDMLSPDPCDLIGDEKCGLDTMEPKSISLASVTVISDNEGTRPLFLRLETRDGLDFSSSLSAAFTIKANTDVEFRIEKSSKVDSLSLRLEANWDHVDDSFKPASDLAQYLDTVEAITYEEIGAAMDGYRSYQLLINQPLNHQDPEGRRFKQLAVLHHRDVEEPMVLYTSGYELFATTDLAETTQMLNGNQISTEQRFFGSSQPDNLQPEEWQFLTIEQAAADHHRIVSLLKPFYQSSWLSTGHSKGGMTSIFHQRFYPDDVEATMAYVAPISFAIADPRYSEFLDSIGTSECRAQFQSLQKRVLQDADVIRAIEGPGEYTYGRFEGGYAAAFEYSVTAMDWNFWQYEGAGSCPTIESQGVDSSALYELLVDNQGLGSSDGDWDWMPEFAPYYYQVMNQLGAQKLGAALLDPLRRHDPMVIDLSPEGVPIPEFDSSAMVDIQRWVKNEADDIVFLYGGHDPWTGGAYDIGANPNLLKVVAAEANHGALISDLNEEDRRTVANRLSILLGAELDVDRTLVAPRAPVLPSIFLP